MGMGPRLAEGLDWELEKEWALPSAVVSVQEAVGKEYNGERERERERALFECQVAGASQPIVP